jgi:hypothetical protein
MNIIGINHNKPLQPQWTKAVRGHALLLLLAAALACSACRYSVPPSGGASQPTATVSPLPGGAATAPATATPPTTETPAPTPTPNPIRVVKVLPNAQVTSNEEYHLNNCANYTPLRQPFSDAAQIWTEVAVSDQATRSDGAIIPVSEPIRSELAHEVELAYQEELAAASATLDQSEMVAAPYTRWYVTVIWGESVFAASISFSSDGMTATAAYTYTQHVPSMGSQQPQACTP